MSLKTALDTLAAIDFGSEIRRHYTMADIRGGLSSPQTPCLIPILTTGSNERETYGETGALFDEFHTIRHRYLDRAATDLLGEAMYRTAQQIDSYFNTIQNLTTRSGALDIRITAYQSGTVEWAGVPYYGCDFTLLIWVSE